ncbi:MAG: Hsp20/alpha crystallin family protein [Deltaproteobacteria bacterium]|nr:MAG: Hsp20/alpha crystallin family protein [Deltaproteobacteria bacterium]
MSPKLADPYGELLRLRELFYELFGRSLPGFGGEEDAASWVVPLDMYRDHENVFIECDVPGVGSEDIDVEVRGSTLVIEGQVRPSAPQDWKVHRMERRRGHFARRIELPPDIDPDGIQATMQDGVLRITLPLAGKARKLKVNVENE